MFSKVKMDEKNGDLLEMPGFYNDCLRINSELTRNCVSNRLDNKYLQIFSIEKLPKRVLVNKKVILNRRNWNCLIGSKASWYCLLCGCFCDTSSKSCMNPQHEANVTEKNHRYLKKYGYAMICELIKSNTFHCGMCNEEITHVDFIKDHCQLPTHKRQVGISKTRIFDFLGNAAITQAAIKTKPHRGFSESIKKNSFGIKTQTSALELYLPITSLDVLSAGVMINKKTRLTNNNFHCIVGTKTLTHCALCNVNVTWKTVQKHCSDHNHMELVKEKNKRILLKYNYGIISELPNPSVYHCGVCNCLVRKEELDIHCKKVKHRRHIKSTLRSAHRVLDKKKSSINDLDIFLTTWNLNNEFKLKYIKLSYVEKVSPNNYMINKQFVFREANWNCILGRGDYKYCALCLKMSVEIKEHVNDETHIKHMKVRSSKILGAFGSHFICELASPNTYHCSYCNKIITGKSKDIKRHCNWKQHILYWWKHRREAFKILRRKRRNPYAQNEISSSKTPVLIEKPDTAETEKRGLNITESGLNNEPFEPEFSDADNPDDGQFDDQFFDNNDEFMDDNAPSDMVWFDEDEKDDDKSSDGVCDEFQIGSDDDPADFNFGEQGIGQQTHPEPQKFEENTFSGHSFGYKETVTKETHHRQIDYQSSQNRTPDESHRTMSAAENFDQGNHIDMYHRQNRLQHHSPDTVNQNIESTYRPDNPYSGADQRKNLVLNSPRIVNQEESMTRFYRHTNDPGCSVEINHEQDTDQNLLLTINKQRKITYTANMFDSGQSIDEDIHHRQSRDQLAHRQISDLEVSIKMHHEQDVDRNLPSTINQRRVTLNRPDRFDSGQRINEDIYHRQNREQLSPPITYQIPADNNIPNYGQHSTINSQHRPFMLSYPNNTMPRFVTDQDNRQNAKDIDCDISHRQYYGGHCSSTINQHIQRPMERLQFSNRSEMHTLQKYDGQHTLKRKHHGDAQPCAKKRQRQRRRTKKKKK